MSLFEDMQRWKERYTKDTPEDGDFEPKPFFVEDEGSEPKPFFVGDDGEKHIDQGEVNLDTSKEEVAASLEDPILKEHMESARSRYLESEQGLNRVPLASDARAKAADGMNKLSQAISSFDDILRAQGTAGDEVSIIGTHLVRWVSSGKQVHPHFPTPPSKQIRGDESLAATCAKANEILQRDFKQLKKCIDDQKAMQVALSQARIALNEAVESFLKIHEAQKDALQKQRELLRAAAPVINAERIRARKVEKSVTGQ